MDEVCKNQLLSTKRAVFMDMKVKIGTTVPKQPLRWCKCAATGLERSEGASAPRHPRQRDFRRKLKQRGRPAGA